MQTRGPWILLPENRAARQAVERVLECLHGNGSRRAINPLFLHGPSGSGKSALVNLLITQLTARSPDRRIALLAASDLPYTSGGDTPEELESARQADLVVVEDQQHLPTRAIESAVHLFDRCISRQRQLVCTATTGPAQLTHLPGRLTSRLGQGLVVGLAALGPASRLDYLRQRQQSSGLILSPDVLDWLAARLPGSTRQLEGALVRLQNLATALGRPPDLSWVVEAFREDVDACTPTVERIAQRVGSYFQVETQQLRSRRRRREALLPRQIGMYLARQLTGLSLEQIGSYFGGRDHTTVLHACRKVEQALGSDVSLSGAVRELRAALA